MIEHNVAAEGLAYIFEFDVGLYLGGVAVGLREMVSVATHVGAVNYGRLGKIHAQKQRTGKIAGNLSNSTSKLLNSAQNRQISLKPRELSANSVDISLTHYQQST